MRVEVTDPDYSPELAGRLSKLETAISKQRTLKFDYWGIARDKFGPDVNFAAAAQKAAGT